MLKNTDIIIFSGIDWDMQWQWQQELATRLSNNNRVIFIENTGVRGLRVLDFKRVLNRIKNFFGNLYGFREINKNLVVYSPIFFPFPYSNFFIRLNSFFISSQIRGWTEHINFNSKYILSFTSTPLTITIIKKIAHDFKVFIYTDKMSKSSVGASKLSEYTSSFAKISDICFYSASNLKLELIKNNKNLYYFYGGVDLSKFKINKKIKKSNKKIIGYIGQVKSVIDQELICKISKKFSDAKIQIIGPIATNINKIKNLNNIEIVGNVSHSKIPNFVQNFDVGLIPYIKNEYTDSISPAKLSEYLSLGVPCVSTNLKEVKNFNKLNKNIISVSLNDKQFLKNIEKYLEMPSTDKILLKRKLIKSAKKFDWKNLYKRFLNICNQNLTTKNLKQKKGWRDGLNLAKFQFRNILIRLSLYLIIGYISIFYIPYASFLGSNLAVYDKLEKSDAIVVISGSGSIEYLNTKFQARYTETLKLYNENLSKKIIIMRREHNDIEEGELIKKLLVFKKIPEENITVVDREFENSFTNYQYINKKYLQDYEKVILITSPYHSLRSKLFFKKITKKQVLIAKSSNVNIYKKIRLGLPFNEIKVILREYIAIIYGYFRGWI